jgi:hypothetical protein
VCLAVGAFQQYVGKLGGSQAQHDFICVGALEAPSHDYRVEMVGVIFIGRT